MDSKKELFERNMEKMRENEEELKAIFDSVRDGIALIDTTGKIIRVNKRILEIGGYTEEEIVGKRLNVLKMFTPRSRARMISEITKAMIPGQPPAPIEMEAYTKTEKNSYVIFIKDNGIGISKEEIDKIFDMGYSKSGTGFGLTIV